MIHVSVIVPIYNGQRHLRQCIESICGQTLKDIEILCIDDGSTDDSLSILDSIAAHDNRLRIIRQKNAGAGAARNTGIREARGEYISFLDADDFFESDMLEKAYYKAKADEADIVLYHADLYHDRMKQFMPCTYSIREDLLPAHRPFAGDEISRNLFFCIVGWAWDKLFRTEYIRQSDLWFQEQRTTNDAYFVFCAVAGSKRIAVLKEVFAHQRRFAGPTLSVTREGSWMCFYHALIAIRQRFISWGIYGRFEQSFINYALHFSLWQFNTLTGDAKEKLYNALRDGWFEALGITQHTQDYFDNQLEYRQYLSIMKKTYNEKEQKWISQFVRVNRLIGHVFRPIERKIAQINIRKSLKECKSAVGRMSSSLLTRISPELNTQMRSLVKTHRWLDLKNPTTFSEKISWLKLYRYPNDPLIIQCADKVRVRDYVQEKGLGYLLNDIYFVCEHPHEIPWNDLPQQVVLKWNFGCGYNVFITDRDNERFDLVCKKLERFGKRKYWLFLAEMHYKNMPRRILGERCLMLPPGQELLDYKFYCFHGEVKAVLVMAGHEHGNKKAVFMSPDWTYMPGAGDKYHELRLPPKPERFDEMLDVAKKLSEDFDFVRVDLFEWKDRVYFGELTFTPAAGVDPTETLIDGKPMGEYLKIDLDERRNCR